MNIRLTVTAAVAVILASVSVYPLIETAGWFWAGVGAVIVAAAAGIITRLPTLHAAVAGSVLALIAAAPLLVSPYWGLKVVGAAIVAVTAASRPRLRVVQAFACVIIYLSALLIYLNALFARHLSTAGIVPTKASLSYLSTLASQGMAERVFEPPVPSSAGVILLAAGGIGLMAAATDLIAVRLRSPAIAGLPLLALYCVRITTAAKQGGVGATIVFCLAMIGYLALLAADGRERLRIWGRLVTVWHGAAAETAEAAEAPDTKALAASGRRIGLAAACIALAFPLLVPGISVHDLFKTVATASGPGGKLVPPPTPLIQMNDQLLSTSPRTVLTYTTNAAQPREQYLQVYVLSYDLSGQAWNLASLDGPTTAVGSGQLRRAQGVTDSTPVTTTTTRVTLGQGNTGYDAKLGFLPLPYAPQTVLVTGGWTEDNASLMVYSTSQQLSGLSYTVTSQEAVPDAAVENARGAYPKNISNGYLSFQAGPHQELAELADQIAARARARTPYQKAVALQNYFRSGEFTYSTSVNLPPGIKGLTEFLYHTHTGYCQQFAFAMAGLARLLGIPSRIAVGYTAGSPAGHRTWKVTTADAHAWPELYFANLGWIRFEPTPGGPGGQGTATVPSYGAPPAFGTEPTIPPTGQGSHAKTALGSGGQNAAHLHNLGLEGTGGASRAAVPGRGIALWVLLIAAIVIAVAVIALPVARSVVRRRRLRTAGDARLAHAVWREVRDDLADYGFGCRPSESPRAVAGRASSTLQLDPSAREALARVASAEERACYATSPLPSPTLRADCATIRRALARQAGRAERWRARLLPTSMLTPIRPALQQALDVFGWMDAAGMKLRGREPRDGKLGEEVRPQE